LPSRGASGDLRLVLRTLLIPLAVLIAAPAASAQTAVAPPSARSSLGITVYDGFAVVRETRAVSGGPASVLVWPGVPPSLDAGTVVLRAGAAPVEIRRQVWEAPLSESAALSSAVGAPVTLVAPDGTRTQGELESADGPTVRVGDRLVVDWPGAVELPAPPDAGAGAALRWELAAPAPASLTAAFLADGLSWAADYTAVLADDSMTLDGFVTVENGTGLAFPETGLQLVAGDVRRAGGGGGPQPAMRMAEMAANDVEQAALGDVHLYTVDSPVTIAPLGSTRVALFHAARVPVRREYVLAGQSWWYQTPAPDLPATEHPQVRIRFENRGIAGADQPLPGGALHAWRPDERGQIQFVGGASVPHTASGEEVVVTIGSAFDLVAERVQTDYRQLDPRTFESAWRIEIRNRGRTAASVLVVEQMPGFEWTIVEESHPHERVDAQVARWTLPVPAGGAATLTYRVRVTQG
jgi:hypothetical protein